jgi:hypothetical protein
MNFNQIFSAMMAMAMISVAIRAALGIPSVTAPAVRACERFPADRNDSIGKFDSGGRQEQLGTLESHVIRCHVDRDSFRRGRRRPAMHVFLARCNERDEALP